MKTRVITAIVALAIFLPILYVGGIWIQVAASVLAVIAAAEVVLMRKTLLVDFGAILTMVGALVMTLPVGLWDAIQAPVVLHRSSLLYIFVILMLLHTVIAKNKFSFEDAGVFTLTMMYVGMGFGMMVAARNAGLDTLMFAFLIVWLTDSGAYMIGRKLGKHKLTKISPNKTWEGSIGGTVVAVIAAAVYTYFFPQAYGWPVMIIISIVLSVAGQFGDLIESGLKRFYKVKDSGNVLPGHGGILDRFDSMLIVLPLMYLIGLFH
ncbi:phosphatidate cytidylyltransferase [Weissella confusa]|uniref:phosphatidate cytidylyltransferase n=1 Tax=Weissella confusa TaxID=1583 RepID=UPI00223AB15F|nr:phosphatidate cytidylyltransferase [Weissella confusa]MCT0005963.1 phosphatidate cytidylyltransferase [Weissella confusa]MCT0019400.1 phosphatidate cytidylyltransferase [Weissella confusa]MCT0040604.1 phosphatidate cytidylyltransferase [Weissella confusa]